MSIDSDHVSCSGILQCIPSLHTVLINARSVRHSWFIQRFTSWTSWKKKLSSVLTCLRILALTSQRSPDRSHVRVLALRQFWHKLLYSGYQPLGLYMIYSTNPLVFSWKEPLHSQTTFNTSLPGQLCASFVLSNRGVLTRWPVFGEPAEPWTHRLADCWPGRCYSTTWDRKVTHYVHTIECDLVIFTSLPTAFLK